jgi:hypothetical protein
MSVGPGRWETDFEEIEKTQSKEQPAKKYDAGKRKWSLLPIWAIEALLVIYEYGCEKYEAYNWVKGMDYTRIYDSAMRHLTAWFMREDFDKESRLLHIAHATWNCLALLAYTLMGFEDKGFDDRPHLPPLKRNAYGKVVNGMMAENWKDEECACGLCGECTDRKNELC